MPITTVVNSSGSQAFTIDNYVYSLQFTMLGASGGGENISPNTLASTAGGNGGATSFLGVSASGGTGGGTSGRNTGGQGGVASVGPIWSGTGVSFSTANGSGGGLNNGGSGGPPQGRVGGNGSDGFNTYVSSATHVFNNSDTETINGVPPNGHNFSQSGSTSDIYLTYRNPNAVDGITGFTPSNGKYYELTFTTPYINSSWSFELLSNCNQAGGGGTGNQPYTFNGYANKDSTGIDLWFQNGGGANGYIRCFTVRTIGIKSGARGAGGGGGAYINSSAIPRSTLVANGFSPGNSTPLVIGARGENGGNTGGCSPGIVSQVSIVQVIYPQVYLNASETVIILGETVNLQWSSAGDLDAIRWPNNADVTNGNIESNSDVSPIVSTTYTAEGYNTGNSELVSYNPEASVTITVYQPPSVDKFDIPLSILYGQASIDVEYETYYANISLTLEVFKTGYTRGPNEGNAVLHTTINLTPGGTAEAGQTTLGEASGTQTVLLAWDDFGPRSLVVRLSGSGDGGSFTTEGTIGVIIDETPDNMTIEESDDLLKDQVPVINPNSEVLSDFYQLNGVDIPVEILSDWPINVDIDADNDWKQVRQI